MVGWAIGDKDAQSTSLAENVILSIYPYISLQHHRGGINMILKSIVIVLLCILLFSCAAIPGMPGHIIESTSKFDNTKQITMEPAWLYNSPIKLALTKTTKIPDDVIVLDAVVKGTYNFSQGKSLHFNIDDQIYSFESIDMITDINTTSGVYNSIAYIPPSNWSSKRYLITIDFLKILLTAKKVWVKIDLMKEFVEGEFSSDAPTTARPAFRDFYTKISKWR